MSSPSTVQLRIHGKIPHIDTIERSYAMRVRDAIIPRLQAKAFFKDFTFRRSHALKIMPALMPYCCVYFMSEQLRPDGNANIGEIRFSSEARIGFQVIMINNDPDIMEDRLDDAHQVIFNTLLRDPTFYNNKVEDYIIEAFSRGSRQHFYGSTVIQNNETPYAELRAELVCDLGAIEYEPIVEDMLETLHVETVHPPDDFTDQNPHVISIYDMDGNITPEPAPVPPPIFPTSKRR
jgi:hypothetical protein